MKINSTEQSLSLALHALDSEIAAEAISPVARNAVEMIRITLRDLLKRQGPALELLQRSVDEGDALEQEIWEILKLHNLSAGLLEPSKSSNSNSKLNGFDELARLHTELTRRLEYMCQRLGHLTATNQKAAAALFRAGQWEGMYYREIQQIAAQPFGDPVPTASQLSSLQPLTAESLQGFLEKQRGPVEIKSLSEIAGGFSHQTFAVKLKTCNKQVLEEELIVRQAKRSPIVLTLEQEYDLLACLKDLRLPTPYPLEFATQLPGVDGSIFTMRRIHGNVASAAVNAWGKTEVSSKILLRLAELAAEFHNLPLKTFDAYMTKHKETMVQQETIEERHHRKLLEWRAHLKEIPHLPSPYVIWLLDWLQNNIPSDLRHPVLTHGDYNLHNIFVNGDEVVGVLDWECADFDAPELDLGYIKMAVSASTDWNIFLEHYYAHGGQTVDEESMTWCSAYAAMRVLVAMTHFACNLDTGTDRDIRLLMIDHGLFAIAMAMVPPEVRMPGTLKDDVVSLTQETKP